MSDDRNNPDIENESGEMPENVQVNPDGSITIAESGLVQAAPPAQRWVGKQLKPDARSQNLLVTKFINGLMLDGKKATAECVFYDAMDQIANKLKSDPLPVFEQALQNAKPLVEVRSKRIGGANYQVPIEVSKKRQQTAGSSKPSGVARAVLRPRSSLRNWSTATTRPVPPSRSARTPTAWPRPTRHSPTLLEKQRGLSPLVEAERALAYGAGWLTPLSPAPSAAPSPHLSRRKPPAFGRGFPLDVFSRKEGVSPSLRDG